MPLFLAKIFYFLFTKFYIAGFYGVALFYPKAKQGIAGRNFTKKLLKNYLKTKKTIWFHVSSLGEFEQARPLIEKLKNETNTIVVSFFSPSGYEIRKNFPLADVVCYLPFDSRENAAFFLQKIKPDIIYWVKYDFWYYFLDSIKEKQIPIYLICANFRKNQPFFQWYGTLHRAMLRCFSTIFVQNEKSRLLLNSIANPAIVAPDTRFDRVVAIAATAAKNSVIEKFLADKKGFIIGSSWESDILHFSDKKITEKILQTHKIIIAPHNVNEASIAFIRKQFAAQQVTTYSQPEEDASVMIIDTIGLLASIYRYAHIAYVGGGFGVSVHNILEAAVYGIPVIFGPHYQKAQEAIDLIAEHACFVVNNTSDLLKVWQLLTDKNNYKIACEKNSAYIAQYIGGTAIILAETTT